MIKYALKGLPTLFEIVALFWGFSFCSRLRPNNNERVMIVNDLVVDLADSYPSVKSDNLSDLSIRQYPQEFKLKIDLDSTKWSSSLIKTTTTKINQTSSVKSEIKINSSSISKEKVGRAVKLVYKLHDKKLTEAGDYYSLVSFDSIDGVGGMSGPGGYYLIRINREFLKLVALVVLVVLATLASVVFLLRCFRSSSYSSSRESSSSPYNYCRRYQ